MPKLAKAGDQNLAKSALLAETPAAQIGNFIEAIHDEDFVTSYLFESNLKGYHGWRWSVTMTQTSAKAEATVSEVLLIAGPESIVAPKWVPWSERLADYKALQAALEEQAKAEAELAAENEAEASESADAAQPESTDSPSGEAEDSASALEVDQHDEAKSDAGEAAAEPPKRFRWLTRKKRH